MNETLVEVHRAAEAAFRKLVAGQYLKPPELALAMVYASMDNSAASLLIAREE